MFARITGAHSGRWLNVELPSVTQTRVDLLFETLEIGADRRLIAMELQSTNDPLLPLRMAEYSLRVYRLHKQFPEQYVLYVGTARLSMPAALKGPNHFCRYTIIDIRKFRAETLVNSPFPADAVIAILARYAERPEIVRRILARIAKIGKGAALDAAFSKLMILAGIRELEEVVRTEAKHMPILNDIMNHKVIGPAIRQGMEQGRELGSQIGRHEEALAILRRLITKRFGPLPAPAEDRLSKLSTAELEDLGDRFVDATTLADLFDRA